MAHTPLDQHILDLLEKNGEMRSRDIYATKPEMSINTIREGEIICLNRGLSRITQISRISESGSSNMIGVVKGI